MQVANGVDVVAGLTALPIPVNGLPGRRDIDENIARFSAPFPLCFFCRQQRWSENAAFQNPDSTLVVIQASS